MKRKLFLSLLFFSLLLVDSGHGSNTYRPHYTYLFVSLSYGRGWFPWTCVVDQGVKPTMRSPNAPPDCIYQRGTLGVMKDCPFEYGTMGGTYVCNSFFGRSPERHTPYPPLWGFGVEISIPEDIKLVDPNGYVIDDEICVGGRFKLSKNENRGEWWERGGHEDSPPIYWVDDVEKLALNMIDYHENIFTAEEDVCQMNDYPDGYIDPLFNIPIYTLSVYMPETLRKTFISGNLVCSLKEKGVDYSGSVNFDGEYYTSTGGGSIDFNVNAVVECMYYYFGSKGGHATGGDCEFYKYNVPTVIQAKSWYIPIRSDSQNVEYNSIEDFFKIREINFQKKLKVIEDDILPNLKHSFSISDSFPRIAKINIKNEGNGKATIAEVYSNVDYEFVVCDKEELNLGEEAECILNINSNDNFGLFFDYEYKDCGRLKEEKVVVKPEITLVSCSNDYDCVTYLCCEGFCRDSDAGFCDDIDRDGLPDTWVPIDTMTSTTTISGAKVDPESSYFTVDPLIIEPGQIAIIKITLFDKDGNLVTDEVPYVTANGTMNTINQPTIGVNSIAYFSLASSFTTGRREISVKVDNVEIGEKVSVLVKKEVETFNSRLDISLSNPPLNKLKFNRSSSTPIYFYVPKGNHIDNITAIIKCSRNWCEGDECPPPLEVPLSLHEQNGRQIFEGEIYDQTGYFSNYRATCHLIVTTEPPEELSIPVIFVKPV